MRRQSHQFCCCGPPLVNVGSYLITIETALVGLTVAVLAFVPPQIVANMDAVPGFAKIIIGCLGIAVLGWQLLGLIAIPAQKTSLYRLYIRINFLLTVATLAASAAFLALAAVQHKDAVAACVARFGATPQGTGSVLSDSSGGTSDTGQSICNAFTWVQIGLMGLIIVLVGVTQLYLCFAQRAYGQKQREATRSRKAYEGSTEEIPLASREAAW